MPEPIRIFVRTVDGLNYRLGRFAMYLFYVLGAILLASTASRLFLGVPINWALEMSQFVLSAYYHSEIGATQELRYEMVPGTWRACLPLDEIGRASAV